MLFHVLAVPIVKPDLYLDPGSGSYIIQVILALLLGGGYALKVYWKRIASLFHRSKNNIVVEETTEPDKNEEQQ